MYVGESNGENLKRDDMLAKKPHWITRLEDTDGDGVFDTSQKFVDNITLPQGMLWYRGSVYCACPPSIWKFTDTDGDGVANQREEILTGFGFSGNACDTHGPFLSPTGRLYIAQGRHGHEFKDKEGKTYSKGKAARIYSCRLDGSDVRVHCGGGFDNPVEIDFTEEGEAIGTVNILYRDRGDCLMHWVEGGVYPREDQADCVAEFKWTGGLLGPIHDLGHVAVSGLMRYRGVHFGKDFKNRWFFTEFNTHKVRYAELKRSGSTFTADVHEFLSSGSGDFHPTDVLEDADGSLLVVDTGAWFLNGCPTSRVSKPEDLGAIWRIRKVDGEKLDDPRGKKLNLAKVPPENWPMLWSDRRPALREWAIDTAARSRDDDWNELYGVEFDLFGPSKVEFTGFVWASARRRRGLYGCPPFPMDVDSPSIRQAAIHTLAHVSRTSYPPNTPLALVHLSLKQQPQIQREAATVLGILLERGAKPEFLNKEFTEKIRQVAITELIDVIRRGRTDRVREHAVIYALIRIGDGDRMSEFLRDDSLLARRAALIILDQMNDSPLTREMIVPLLSSDDLLLVNTAIQVISHRTGWGAETLTLFCDWLKEADLSADRLAALQGFVTAQIHDPSVQQFVAETLAGLPAKTVPLRRALVEIIQHAAVDPWPAAWNELLRAAFDDVDVEIRQRAFETVQIHGMKVFDEVLHKIHRDSQRLLEDRMLAFAAVAPRETISTNEFTELQQIASNGEKSSIARLNAAKSLAVLPLDSTQLMELTEAIPKLAPMELRMVLSAFAKSTDDQVGRKLITQLERLGDSVNIGPDELAAILRRYSPIVQQSSLMLLRKLGVDPEAQRLKLAELSPLLEGGDANVGRIVFAGKKANCAACHQVAGAGGRLGPDLTKIAVSRTPHDLLEAIIYPSASFVNGYRPFVIATHSGKIYTGVISAETAETVTLKLADLTEVRVSRREIDEMKEGTVSIMPKGLDTQLTSAELRDLLAYLQGRK